MPVISISCPWAETMILRYAKGNSALHHLNPLSKLSFIAAWSMGIFFIDSLAVQVSGLVFILVLDCAMGSGSLRPFLTSRSVIMLGTTILCMQVLFTPTGNVLWTAPIAWPHLVLTDPGVLRGVLLTLRFLNIILAGGVFVATTDPASLAHSLMRIGVPYRYGFMILMMLRFIPLFEEERIVISNAQKMRGLELDKPGPRKLVLSIRCTVLPLIVSALAKADALELSMEGRAFGYKETRTFLQPDLYRWMDRSLIAASFSALALLIALALRG
jgi:energy-coupling factor transport system permease protein